MAGIYIHIHFCNSRCKYCDFCSTTQLSRQEEYVEALLCELADRKHELTEEVRTIYIGGGTPSVLTAEQLDFLLNNLHFGDIEFTVECGRPDTITTEKLDVLKKHKVTRISINPQTFSEKTLQKIGRQHTTLQIFDAFKEAKKLYNQNLSTAEIAEITGFCDENYFSKMYLLFLFFLSATRAKSKKYIKW